MLEFAIVAAIGPEAVAVFIRLTRDTLQGEPSRIGAILEYKCSWAESGSVAQQRPFRGTIQRGSI